MKNLSSVSALVLIFSFVAFAQTNQHLSCPTISITGPAGVFIPNESVIFTAAVDKKVESFKVKYKWTVVNGKIIGGQGTLMAEVLQTDFTKGLTARFEVIGLPKGCPTTVSESMIADSVPQALLIEELSSPIAQIEKARDFKKPVALENNPDAQLYIIFSYKKNTPKKIIIRTEQKIFENLTKIGIEKDRITLIKKFADSESLQFWLVPTGASLPITNN